MILEAVKRALAEMINEGIKQEDIAIVTGIGCHAKIFDYLNVNGFYGLHGRVIPISMGIKLGNLLHNHKSLPKKTSRLLRLWDFLHLS